jgi:hypothetical protein
MSYLMLEPTPQTRASDRLSWPLGAALVVWIALAVAGWYGISAYGFKGDPQATTAIVPQWPAESAIARMTDRPTLVLFLHPKCPCSRATVAELERLPVLVPGHSLPDICIVASAPRALGDLWWSTPFLERAAGLPNARLVRDSGGVETTLFGARISGTVLLFDSDGNRLYAGGVTMSRGHAGDNVGLQAVTGLLVDHDANVSSIPPLGCEMVRERREPASPTPVSCRSDRDSPDELSTSKDSHLLSRSAGGDPA